MLEQVGVEQVGAGAQRSTEQLGRAAAEAGEEMWQP